MMEELLRFCLKKEKKKVNKNKKWHMDDDVILHIGVMNVKRA